MTESNISTIIQNLEKELSHRLEKLWRVFSWTSSILVGIIGSIVVLTRSQEKTLKLSDRILISIVIVILVIYAFQWLKENLKFEGVIRKQLETLFNDTLNYNKISEIRPLDAKYGFTHVVLLLGSTAILAVWIDLIFK